MEKNNQFFILQLLVTIGLVFCAVGLFPGSVIGFKIEIAVLLSGGLWFSWFRINRANGLLRLAAPVAFAIICVWMLYKILGASLEYRDIVIVLIKGLIFIEVALSFTLCIDGFTGYVQALSIPLFMAQALFIKEYTPQLWALIVIYLALLVVAMRLQFYNPVDSASPEGGYALFFNSGSFALSIGLLLVSTAIGGFLATAVPLSKLTRYDVPFATLGEGEQNWRDDYYEKLDQVQKDTSGVMLDLQSRDRRIESLANMNNLVKDSPLTMDADKGEQGLISLLNTPGAGLADVRLENRRHLGAYSDSKTRFEQNTAQERVSQDLRKDPLNVPARMSVMNYVSRVRQAKTLEDIRKLPDAQKRLNDLPLEDEIKSDVIKQLNHMQEWKLYEIYRADLAYLDGKAQAMGGEKKASLQELIENVRELSQMAGIEAVQNAIDKAGAGDYFNGTDIVAKLQEALGIKTHMLVCAQAERAKEDIAKDPDLSDSIRKELFKDIDKRAVLSSESSRSEKLIPYRDEAGIPLKSLEIVPGSMTLYAGEYVAVPSVIGTCTDGSQWEMAQLCSWNTTDSNNAYVVGANISAVSAGKTQLTAVYGPITSLPVEIIIEQPDDQPANVPPDKEIVPSARGILDIVAGWIVLAVSVLMAIVSVLLYLTGLRRVSINEKAGKPREFIIALYENLRRIFDLLGIKVARTMMYRHFARHVNKTYLFDDRLFIEITDIYEEARFSGHAISESSVPEISSKYNQLIKNVLSQCSATRKIGLYVFALLHRLPVNI